MARMGQIGMLQGRTGPLRIKQVEASRNGFAIWCLTKLLAQQIEHLKSIKKIG